MSFQDMHEWKIKGDVLEMKKLFKLLGGTVAGLALAAVVSLAGNAVGNNVAYADGAACIKVTDGINVNEQNANATVKLTGGCGTHKLVMKTYFAPSATGAPHDKQVLAYTGDPKTLNPGSAPYKFHVKSLDPGCFYQIDIVDITDGATGGHNPVIAAKTGGNHDCTPTIVKPACTALGLTPGANRSVVISTFTVATGTNITLTGATIDWSDGTVENFPTALNRPHTFAQDGNYTVKVTAHFTYYGQFGEKKTGDAVCQAPISFTTPPPEVKTIFVCEIATKKIIQIDEAEFGTHKYPLDQFTKDLSKCVVKHINVCDLTTKTIVNIREEEFDASKHTTDLSKCVTPPVTPPTTPPATLVNTGPGSIVALTAATSVVAAAAHAIWRRRSA
jgi:hypothetical protein